MVADSRVVLVSVSLFKVIFLWFNWNNFNWFLLSNADQAEKKSNHLNSLGEQRPSKTKTIIEIIDSGDEEDFDVSLKEEPNESINQNVERGNSQQQTNPKSNEVAAFGEEPTSVNR